MAKLSLDDLKKLRDEKKKEMNARETDKEIQIVIGMGTCGIAAGAKQTFDAFVDELSKHDVIVRDLSSIPSGASGGIVMGGVYGGR